MADSPVRNTPWHHSIGIYMLSSSTAAPGAARTSTLKYSSAGNEVAVLHSGGTEPAPGPNTQAMIAGEPWDPAANVAQGACGNCTRSRQHLTDDVDAVQPQLLQPSKGTC